MKIILFAIMASAGATVAAAQSVTLNRDNPAPISGNPDRMICEREETIGSRLGGKKVCMKASDWEERRREHRINTEKVQMDTRARRSE